MPKKRIMIIDDDEMSTLLSRRLHRHGYSCRSAQSVAEGLDLLRSYNPDVVILDLMMDKVSGSAFLASSPTPTIVLSGIDDQEITEFVLKLGAKRYLTKPYN